MPELQEGINDSISNVFSDYHLFVEGNVSGSVDSTVIV